MVQKYNSCFWTIFLYIAPSIKIHPLPDKLFLRIITHLIRHIPFPNTCVPVCMSMFWGVFMPVDTLSHSIGTFEGISVPETLLLSHSAHVWSSFYAQAATFLTLAHVYGCFYA